jgi:DNA-binding CsgD family transcriptional regulator
MAPVLLENSCPLVERTNRVRVGAVEHLATVTAEVHQTDVPQHLEVLRNGRLAKIELLDDVADVTFLRRQVGEDVAALNFSDGVEDVRCRRSTGHESELYSHYGICQFITSDLPALRALPAPPASTARRVRDDTGVKETAALARGRDAFEREAWSEAYEQLLAADAAAPLGPADLERLAAAAHLVGEDAASIDALTRAHQEFLEQGDAIAAARNAVRLAFSMFERPAVQAQATGWVARARRLFDECGTDCAEHGFLLCAEAFMKVRTNDPIGAGSLFARAVDVGARFKNRDVLALARHGQGRVLLFQNRTAEGLAILDEVMVSVTCGEVDPIISGVVYCSVLSACHDLFDLRRAKEWTTALSAWCEAHPDMLFRGECLVRRSEMLQLEGAWDEALAEAEQACARLGARSHPRDAGTSPYRAAELHRLRGEFDKADELYRRASQAGRNPHPGLALLRLAQGQVEVAAVAIRHELQQRRTSASRAETLRAGVEILLAANDAAAARSAAEELTRTANAIDAPFLRASSYAASGAVALAEGDAASAMAQLRDACAIWRELEAPYELARARESTGLAYRQLGDEEGAQLELEAASETYERLGARPDAARVVALSTASLPDVHGPLTGREVEVLRLIAAGKTNRTIASELAISEKTVARHVSNILTKLDLPSRSAATAYAYSRNLV